MALRGGHVRKRFGKIGHGWQIIIERPPDPVTGERKRIYKTVSGVTKKDAERIMREMMSDLENDTYVKNTTLTVGSFSREWLDTWIRPFMAVTTIESYEYSLERYIIPQFGNVYLTKLSSIAIQKWFNQILIKSPLSDKPVSPKTARNIFMNLNAMLKRAVKLGHIKVNPAQDIVLPKCPKYKPTVYGEDELKILMDVAKGTTLETAIMLFLTLGIRRGEAMSLCYSDVDFENKLVKIDKSVVKVKGKKSVTKDPKSESGKRVLEAPDVLIEYLRRERMKYLKRKFQYGADFHDSGLVICQPNGKSYEPDYFTHKFQRLLEVNGLPKLRLHDLRHSHITFLLKLGVNIKIIQRRAGHSTINTTLDTYSHILSDMGREAADTLNTGLRSIVANVI